MSQSEYRGEINVHYLSGGVEHVHFGKPGAYFAKRKVLGTDEGVVVLCYSRIGESSVTMMPFENIVFIKERG